MPIRPAISTLVLPGIASNPQENSATMDELKKQSSSQWLRDSPSLCSIGRDVALFHRFEAALQRIEATSIGEKLLHHIDTKASPKEVKIVFATTNFGVIANDLDGAQNGNGTGSELHCDFGNPELTALDVIDENPKDVDAARLFHELIHVLHNLNGEKMPDSSSDPETASPLQYLHEEARTVGLGKFKDEEFSENAFRSQIGLPRRVSYAHESAKILDDDTVIVGLNPEPQPLFR